MNLSYDCTQKDPVRNCLKIYLDASAAMFDTQVKCITFYNCKILFDDSDKGGYQDGGLDGCCWMQDILKYENGKFILEITALGEDDFLYVIQFDGAHVER